MAIGITLEVDTGAEPVAHQVRVEEGYVTLTDLNGDGFSFWKEELDRAINLYQNHV